MREQLIDGIYFMIIPTARKMYGHEIKGFPVRHRHELIRFVTEGVINLRLPGENLLAFKCWENDIFSVTDLIQYCSPAGLHAESFNALEKAQRSVAKNVFEIKYVLNLVKFVENMKTRFRYREHLTQ